MPCPFYGYAVVGMRSNAPVLMPSSGNQCALITESHAPCFMKAHEARPPNWFECPRNPEWMTEAVAAGEEPATLRRLAKHAAITNDTRRMRAFMKRAT